MRGPSSFEVTGVRERLDGRRPPERSGVGHRASSRADIAAVINPHFRAGPAFDANGEQFEEPPCPLLGLGVLNVVESYVAFWVLHAYLCVSPR